MKKILIFSLTTFFIFMFNFNARAQTVDSLILANYKSDQELSILFENNNHVIIYFSGIELEKPTFIALANDNHIENIRDNNIEYKILDKGVSLEELKMFYHPQKDQSNKLAVYGKVYPIPYHYTLLRFDPSLYKEEGLPVAEFFPIEIESNVADPVFPSPSISKEGGSITFHPILLYVFLGFLVVGVIALAIIFWKRRKLNSSLP